MSGFMSSSTALSVFTIADPKAITTEKLRKHAFVAGNAGEEKVWGWTSVEDITDTQWHRSIPEKGEFLIFSMRIDTRKVSGAVLKLHMQEALHKEEEANRKAGKQFISRARKKELKELQASKLLAKTEPVPTTADIAVDTSNGYVYIGSTSNAMLECITEAILQQFGEILTPLYSVDAEATCQLLRNIYDSSKNVMFDGHSYTLGISETSVITLAAQDGSSETVNSKGELESVEAALKKGLKITKIQLSMEQENAPENSWQFTLDSTLNFSGLKTPPIAKNEDDDQDAVLLEKLYLLSRVAGVVGVLTAVDTPAQ